MGWCGVCVGPGTEVTKVPSGGTVTTDVVPSGNITCVDPHPSLKRLIIRPLSLDPPEDLRVRTAKVSAHPHVVGVVPTERIGKE